MDLNLSNQISQIQTDFNNLQQIHSNVSNGISQQIASVENTARQMLNGFSLYGFTQGIQDAADLAASTIKGLTIPKDVSQIVPEKVLKTPEVGNSLQARIDNKGPELPLLDASKEDIKTSIQSLLPYTPHPQHYYKDNVARLMRETTDVPGVEADHASTNATRSNIIDGLSPVSTVVENATKITEDLKNIAAIQDQISSVSEKISKSISTVQEQPFKFLSTACDEFKKTVSTYIQSYDSLLSPLSEIAPSKNFSQTLPEEKNPDKLKARLNSTPQVPGMPGNLFYLATGNNLQEHNPDLYSKVQELKTHSLNSNKKDEDIINDLMPLYGIPGFNSLDVSVKQTLNKMLSLNEIINNPEDDLSSFIPAMGLRSKTNYDKFENLKEIDNALKELNLDHCYNILSLAVQYNFPESNSKLWLIKLKVLSAKFYSISDALYLLFMDRASNKNGSDLNNIWSWIFSISPSYDSMGNELLSELSGNTEFLEHLQKSENFILYKLQVIKNTFGTKESIIALTDSWKNTIENTGGFLGFQAFPSLLSLLVLDRIKLVSNSDDLSDDEKETIIKKLSTVGSKYAGYLLNGTHIKNAFKFLSNFGS